MANDRVSEEDPAQHSSHSRHSSHNSISSLSSGPPTPQAHSHAPQTPSRLRQSHAPSPSPESQPHPAFLRQSPPTSPPSRGTEMYHDDPRSSVSILDFEEDGMDPGPNNESSTAEDPEATRVRGNIPEQNYHAAATESTRLLENYSRGCNAGCGHSQCDHGTFSPHAPSFLSRDEGENHLGYDGRHEVVGSQNLGPHGGGNRPRRPNWGRVESWMSWGGGGNENGRNKSVSITRQLLDTHGIKRRWRMYISYYIPFVNWISQYRLAWLKGDIIAAVTMASFYIPMSLSYAANLGHIPPINGLYSFVFNPLIYALLGTCPQMVVGPEAAGSLLLGNVIRTSVNKGSAYEGDEVLQARIAGIVTGIAGAVILVAGLTRLGFLDNVLSRPFLRGFISAIGIVIFADQLIPEMGLTELSKVQGADHASSIDKLIFVCKNIGEAHSLTCLVSFVAFFIIMFCRTAKRQYESRFPSVAYIPDRFIVVVLSAVFTYSFGWDKQGLAILGEVKSSSGSAFPFHWPFLPKHMTHIREAVSTSFLIALLGFFESSVAAKALGGGDSKPPGEAIQGMTLSANRELVALGVANVVGGCFMALPAFGGYGRSKVNSSTGGRTPMSSILLSFLTIISVLYLVPYFYYLPKGVLSAMVSVVAYSLIEEAPHDIRFFIKVRGWAELALIFLIFFATLLWSLPVGIALGMGLSLLSVIRHATKPRIQILGRVPGTQDQFENAEYLTSALAIHAANAAQPDYDSTSHGVNPPSIASQHTVEFVPNALIVKIPEPLTFANTGDLRSRLRRLELYGSTAAHPALPRIRDEAHNRNVVFDIHGVTSIDASGAQVLSEIVEGYVQRGNRVFFCRVPGGMNGRVMLMMERAGIVEACGGGDSFTKGVEEAIKLAERERGPV